MRRTLSILLMAVFWMPSFAPLLAMASTGEARVPACCRLHGQHRCVMSESERAALQEMGLAAPELRAPVQPCPYQQPPVRTLHDVRFAVPVSDAVYAAVVSHPTGLAQTHSKWRVSRERSRQKRGPPADLLS